MYMNIQGEVKKDIAHLQEHFLKLIAEKDKLQEEILSLKCENEILHKEMSILRRSVKKWEAIQNTEEMVQMIMKKKNKWWVLDSVEESIYRSVIEMIQNM